MKPCLMFSVFFISTGLSLADSWTNAASTSWYNASASSFSISNAQQLAGLSVLVNGGNTFAGKTITLSDNIDLTGKEWTAIGTSAKRYQGTFSGGGRTVMGVTIYKPTSDYQGLWGYLGDGSRIEDVTLVGTDIRGRSYVGSVVGYAVGSTLQNCSNSGNVSGTNYVGGVAGYVGYNTSASKVESCRNIGNVNGVSSVGGVVGQVSTRSSTQNCTNSGSVSGTTQVGGVAGYAVESPVENCMNSGGVCGTNEVGGVAGRIRDSTVANCANAGNVVGASSVGGLAGYTGMYYSHSAVVNCYSIGSVSGSSNAGGVAGTVSASDLVVSCYWKKDGAPGYNLNAAGTGATTDCYFFGAAPGTLSGSVYGTNALLDALNAWVNDASGPFSGTTLWTLSGSTTGYPVLTETFSTVYWSHESHRSMFWYTSNPGASSYSVGTAEDLAGLAHLVNSGTNFTGKTIVLSADVDLSGRPWIAIGTSSKPFRGMFDGNSKTITGVTINKITSDYQGCFGYVGGGGTVKKVTVINADIKGATDVGGVVGTVQSGAIIDNCTNNGRISGYTHVGGVAGDLGEGSVTNCMNFGSVSGSSSVGGVAGSLFSSTSKVRKCMNRGTISGTNQVGGVAGHVFEGAIVENCANEGSVSGASDVGGVAGSVYNGNGSTLQDCSNSGQVSGTGSSVGGVAGSVEYSQNALRNCANSGDVNGSSSVGGVVGYVAYSYSTTAALNCTNSGGVRGTSQVGGVAGKAVDVSLENCSNIGSVDGTGSEVGGVAGRLTDGMMANCANAGNVVGVSSVGGVAGYTDNYYSRSTVVNCFSIGSVSGSSNAGGVAGTVSTRDLVINCYWKKDGGPGYNLNAVGIGATTDCYFFGAAPGTLIGSVYGTTALLDALNAWVNDASGPFSGTTLWTLSGSTTGYPVLAETFSTVYWSHESHRSTSWYTANPGASSYSVGTAEEMAGLAHLVNSGTNFTGKTIVLSADVDLSGRPWIAIGTSSKPFRGMFDGNSKTITGVTINKITSDNQGYFGCIGSGGTVKNVTLINADIKGATVVGGVVGTVADGTIRGCSNSGSVNGYSSVGGITGDVVSGGIINNCTNSGWISGYKDVGGVAGFLGECTVTNCINVGIVSGSSSVGGVAGYLFNASGVRNCTNSGIISGTNQVGGVAGYVYSAGTVANCANYGSVSGYSKVGGVSGEVGGGIVQNCANNVNVSGTGLYVGGVAGIVQYSGRLVNCSNEGVVNGTECVGGAVGYVSSSGRMANCANSGSVSGTKDIGGVAGSVYTGGMANNCYWKKDGQPGYSLNAAGSGAMTDCYYFGNAPGTLNGLVSIGITTTDVLLTALNAYVVSNSVSSTSLCSWTLRNSPTGYPVLILGTQATATSVPFMWIEKYYPGTTDYEFKGGETGVNGMSLSESYVAGLVPTNPTSHFFATITVTNFKPTILWTPNLFPSRIYTVEGKTNLADTVWGPTNLASRIFRVIVEMP